MWWAAQAAPGRCRPRRRMVPQTRKTPPPPARGRGGLQVGGSGRGGREGRAGRQVGKGQGSGQALLVPGRLTDWGQQAGRRGVRRYAAASPPRRPPAPPPKPKVEGTKCPKSVLGGKAARGEREVVCVQGACVGGIGRICNAAVGRHAQVPAAAANNLLPLDRPHPDAISRGTHPRCLRRRRLPAAAMACAALPTAPRHCRQSHRVRAPLAGESAAGA